jgi:micrococcal nuclease
MQMNFIQKRLFLLLLFLFSVSSCIFTSNDQSEKIYKSTGKPVFTAIPTLVIPSEYSCVPRKNDREMAFVIKVIDGDSIEVEKKGQKFQVRYIGINAPEYDSAERREAEIARQKNVELVMGKTIWMVKDVREKDQYGRLLRFVFVDQIFVNLELVKHSIARAQDYPPDISCQSLFRRNMPG